MKPKRCDNCGADATTIHPCSGPCQKPVPTCDLCATMGGRALPGHYVCSVCNPDVDRAVRDYFHDIRWLRAK